MEFCLKIPVLLVAFNRPEITEIVFDKIRNAKPLKLYIAVDGPRSNYEGEEKLVNKVKAILKNVDWSCEVRYHFNEQNLGAEITITSAISWALKNEEYIIILEDDIVAPISFFRFAEEMLIKYKDDDRIATITGSNFTPIEPKNGEDYFFGKYGHSWGWGTWRRNWEKFDLNMEIPIEHTSIKYLMQFCNSKAEARYFQKHFKYMKKKGPGNNTWDAMGSYYHRINNTLSVIPRVNLTSNIGIYGLHAKGTTVHHFRPFDENFVINKHPDIIECNVDYDIHHFKTYINRKAPFYKRLFKKILKIFRLNKSIN